MSSDQPVLLLFKGHPGVGKSTLARAVCKDLRWPLIDKDDARDCLQAPEANCMQLDLNQISYDIMFRYCETQLQLGLSTVLDCPLARVALYNRASRLAEQYGAVVAVVECVASNEEVWRQQLESRACTSMQPHKPQTWADLQKLLHRYEGSYTWNTGKSCALDRIIVVDTTKGTLDQRVQQIVSFLSDLRCSMK